MDNYHTASNCGCSQDMPQSKMPGNSSQGSSAPCAAQCASGTGQATRRMASQPSENSCPANMRQRQMANTQRQMAQIQRNGGGAPCPASIGQRQIGSIPHHMANRPSRPQMAPPCPSREDPLSGMPIAMAYVPWQFFQETYEPDKALQYGTIFPELNKPFYGKGGCPK